MDGQADRQTEESYFMVYCPTNVDLPIIIKMAYYPYSHISASNLKPC